jgi:hypothetical protein
MNAFALILLQKKIADTLGVPVGSYIPTPGEQLSCLRKKLRLVWRLYPPHGKKRRPWRTSPNRYAGEWDELDGGGPDRRSPPRVAREKAKGNGAVEPGSK